VAEELGLTLDLASLQPLGFADEPGGDGRASLVLLLFEASVLNGEPSGHEGQRWGWFTTAEVAALPLAPLDRVLLGCLPAERVLRPAPDESRPHPLAKPESPAYEAPFKARP
jgi:8-oxo-dGTP diphosphatase